MCLYFYYFAVNLQSIRDIKAADICAVYGEGRSSLNEFHIPHLALMHAILLFPSFIRGLLEKLNIKGEQKIAGMWGVQTPELT